MNLRTLVRDLLLGAMPGAMLTPETVKLHLPEQIRNKGYTDQRIRVEFDFFVRAGLAKRKGLGIIAASKPWRGRKR